MNKYQEALDWVREGNDSCGTEWDFLQELVDKEKPVKPLWEERGRRKCSVCRTVWVMSGYRFSYCPKCSQKIDWSDND